MIAGKVNAARIFWCALKGCAAEENAELKKDVLFEVNPKVWTKKN